MHELLLVGQVSKPQGVKGEIKVQTFTDNPSRFFDLHTAYFVQDSGTQSYAITCNRVADGFVFLQVDGVQTREQADLLRGALIKIDRKDAVKLPEGVHFIVDLVGCEVVGTQGHLYGQVMDVLQPGSADVYVIKGKRNLMLPALKHVVIDVDVPHKRIILDEARAQEVAVYEDENSDALPDDV